MHHILFDNNDWIFDAATDPIITILPERYFLCCGMGIILFLLLAAAVLSHLQNRVYLRAENAGKLDEGEQNTRAVLNHRFPGAGYFWRQGLWDFAGWRELPLL